MGAEGLGRGGLYVLSFPFEFTNADCCVAGLVLTAWVGVIVLYTNGRGEEE